MTLILGIDPSQKTGFSFWDDARSLSSMTTGLIKAPVGKNIPIEEKAASLGRQLCLMIRQQRPDIIAIEEPMRRLPAGGTRKVKFLGEEQQVEGPAGGAAAMISSNQIVGAIVCVCAIKDIPFITLMPSTWRKHWFGFGTHSGWTREDWKKAARERCSVLKIAVSSHDAAEACGIAFAATATPEFKMLRHQKEKAA